MVTNSDSLTSHWCTAEFITLVTSDNLFMWLGQKNGFWPKVSAENVGWSQAS